MRYMVSYGMERGVYTPKTDQIRAKDFDEAARLAKENYSKEPWGDQIPTKIIMTSLMFEGAVYDFETLKRER